MKIKKTLIYCLSLSVLFSILTNRGNVNKETFKEDKANAGEVVVNKKIDLLFPQEGSSVHILKPQVLEYINAMKEQAKNIENDYILHDFYVCSDSDGSNYGVRYSNDTDLVDIADYYSPSINMEKSKLVNLVFDADGFDEDSTYTVYLSTSSDMENPVIIETKDTYVNVTNLLSGTTYYWKVESDNTTSEVHSFTTDEGFRMVTASGINNVRDMGGRTVAGNKKIRQGVIYRGGEMVSETYTTSSGSTHYGNLTEENKKVMQDELNIKYEIDFRGEEESNYLVESPLKDESHPDIKYMRIDNLQAYDYFFKTSSTDERWAQIKEMFLAFKDSVNNPVYFHCWGGADRTGTIGFLLGGLLGMSYTDLIIDFELTSFSCNFRTHFENDISKVYRLPQFIYQLKNAVDSNGNTYYQPDKTISDIIKDVLIDKTGLTEQDIADIKSALLVD